MGTHLRVLSERDPMDTSMTILVFRLDDFQTSLPPCALDESGLSIGWVKQRRVFFRSE